MNPYSTDEPRFHILAGQTKDVDQYVAKMRSEGEPRTAVRVLRGANMQSMEGFYDELAAALQFPLYFGRNWAALEECLADFEWLPSDAYLLIFADAPSILGSTGNEDAEAFLKLLSRSSKEWANGSSLGGGLERRPRPFHVVLHARVAEAEHFLHIIEAVTGEQVSKITIFEGK